MFKKANLFSRIRLVYRRSSLLLKCVVLATILLSTVALVALRLAILDQQKQAAQLRAQAAVLEQENDLLESHIAELGTVTSVKRIASQELGLVDPDSIIFTPSN